MRHRGSSLRACKMMMKNIFSTKKSIKNLMLHFSTKTAQSDSQLLTLRTGKGEKRNARAPQHG